MDPELSDSQCLGSGHPVCGAVTWTHTSYLENEIDGLCTQLMMMMMTAMIIDDI